MKIKKSVGRPPKKNAVKPGQVQPGFIKYTFIVEERLIRKMKSTAQRKGLSIKGFMDMALKNEIDFQNTKEGGATSISQKKKERLLLEYIKNQQSL
jgi:hypothetical protein